jgi:hypothetical protein
VSVQVEPGVSHQEPTHCCKENPKVQPGHRHLSRRNALQGRPAAALQARWFPPRA